MRKLFYIITIFLSLKSFSQNVFPEKFSGCITDQFALESDSIIGVTDFKKIIKIVYSSLDEKSKSKINGELSLQIIVNKDGSSCLISLKNDTNIKSSKLKLKETIDSNLKWEIPFKKVSPLIILKFNSDTIIYRRLGVNLKKGNHNLEEEEISIELIK